MINLFSDGVPSNTGLITVPNWRVTRDTCVWNLEKIFTSYRQFNVRVISNHLLVRLLHSLNVPLNLDDNSYYDNVCDITYHLGGILGMTTEVSRGKTFDGVFYKEGCSEIIIGHKDKFDLENANINWDTLEPVKVIRHPFSDLSLNLPDGHYSGTEKGISVITVNIPMLAVMCRKFIQLEDIILEGGGIPKGVSHFINMHVLPNMMASHFDQVIMNRISNMAEGIDNGKFTKRHPFILTPVEHRLNLSLWSLFYDLSKVDKKASNMLLCIPAISETNMYDVMQLPRILENTNNAWALALSRTRVLKTLSSINGGLMKMDGTTVNEMRRYFKWIDSANVYTSILSYGECLSFEKEMASIT